MRYHFIVNPIAGRTNALALMGAVADRLSAQGAACTHYVTEGAGDAATHVATLDADMFDRLVVVGGDGTLREVVNGRPPPIPWPVGVVPCGTANLAGRELRMPLGSSAARIARSLHVAQPWRVDLLTVSRNGAPADLAVSTIGAGLDAEIVHRAADARAVLAGVGGYLRWVRPMWDTLRTFHFPRLRVTVDGHRTYAAGACVVQNARSYGGPFELSPEAGLDSGRLDVFLIRTRTHRDLFRILFGAWLKRAHRFRDVKVVQGTQVRLAADRTVPLQADGDPAGRTEVRIGLLPRALTLLRA